MSDASQAEIETLVRQLIDPRTRRAARQELMRRRAAGAFIECLNSPNESVAWAAVQSLGELRAREALAPLVDELARGRLAVDVAEALTAISGQDFGVDVRPWRAWLAGQPAGTQPASAASASPVAAGVDPAACLRQAAELLGSEPSGGDKSFEFRLSQPGERSQRVKVQFARAGREGEELVLVYSECGPAQPKQYEAALRRNLQLPVGAFGIRDKEGTPTLVLVETLPAATLTARVLARAIESIAARADAVEKDLTAGQDAR